MKAKDLIAMLQSIDPEAEVGVGANDDYYHTEHNRSHGPVKLIKEVNYYVLGIYCDDSPPGTITALDGKVMSIDEYYKRPFNVYAGVTRAT